MQSPELEAKLRQFKPFIEYIGVNAGYDNVTLKDIVLFYDTLFIEKLKGLTYAFFPSHILYLMRILFKSFSHVTEYCINSLLVYRFGPTL